MTTTNPKRVGYYARTSTNNQDGQRFDLNGLKAKGYRVFFDKGITGTMEFDQRPAAKQLQRLIDDQQIDTIIVESLDRLGRTTHDILKTLHQWDEQGLRVEVKNLNLCNQNDDGSENVVWKILVPLMSSIAQIERNAIKQRIDQGREIARVKGVRFGRKFGSVEKRQEFMLKEKNQKIISLLIKGKSYQDIRGRLGVSFGLIKKVKTYLNYNG